MCKFKKSIILLLSAAFLSVQPVTAFAFDSEQIINDYGISSEEELKQALDFYEISKQYDVTDKDAFEKALGNYNLSVSYGSEDLDMEKVLDVYNGFDWIFREGKFDRLNSDQQSAVDEYTEKVSEEAYKEGRKDAMKYVIGSILSIPVALVLVYVLNGGFHYGNAVDGN